MDIINAAVVEENDNHYIDIGNENPIRIVISSDDPKQIKTAFNLLLIRLKEGEFEIDLNDDNDNLFCQVAKEYVTQLNSELKEVYEEMLEHRLVDEW